MFPWGSGRRGLPWGVRTRSSPQAEARHQSGESSCRAPPPCVTASDASLMQQQSNPHPPDAVDYLFQVRQVAREPPKREAPNPGDASRHRRTREVQRVRRSPGVGAPQPMGANHGRRPSCWRAPLDVTPVRNLPIAADKSRRI